MKPIVTYVLYVKLHQTILLQSNGLLGSRFRIEYGVLVFLDNSSAITLGSVLGNKI